MVVVRIAACLTLVMYSLSASAQMLPGAWHFDSAFQRDGRQFQASIRSSTLLSSSDDPQGYAPTFVISCTAGDPLHWQQQLMLEEPLTSRGVITIRISLDGNQAFDEQWVVSGQKRIATKVGVADIERLAGAKRMKLQWNWGWSWLWLSDEVEFNLSDMQAVVFTLAKSCSVPVPGAD